VAGEARIGELSGLVVVIHEVASPGGSFSLLPTRWHQTKVNTRHILNNEILGYPGVVPGADPRGEVVEVDLPLLRGPHLVSLGQVWWLVQDCARQEPLLGGVACAPLAAAVRWVGEEGQGEGEGGRAGGSLNPHPFPTADR